MTNKIHILRPDQPPLIEVDDFNDDLALRGDWAKSLGETRTFLGDYYWRFDNESGGRGASLAVGRLALGLSYVHSEFAGIGNTISTDGTITRNGVARSVSYFALSVSVGKRFYDPNRTAIGLIAATNDDLRALNSPYILPLPEL